MKLIRDSSPGASDTAVIALARQEGRLLLTMDKDFGELAFRSRLSSHCGIILLRLRSQNPEVFTQMALRALQSRPDWNGHFSVISEDRIRMKPLRSTG